MADSIENSSKRKKDDTILAFPLSIQAITKRLISMQKLAAHREASNLFRTIQAQCHQCPENSVEQGFIYFS